MKVAKIDSYSQAVSYILEIPRFLAKNDTESTKECLRLIGEGDIDTVIHVAGTNGKGSTCAFLNSVFMKMGRRTGMFTSPHLVDIRERIQVNGCMIGEDEFLKCTNYVIDKINDIREYKENYHPSFFEFVFFIAVRYFAMKQVDVAIYETGLGGRLDATNSLEKKDICVITEIGMDHMEYLGDTLEKIAAEKAGIIAGNVPVVFWNGRSECAKVIEERANELGSEAYGISGENVKLLCIQEKNIDFSYEYGYDNKEIFTVLSYAQYQIFNAAMALKTLQVLGIDISSEAVREGILDMNWPGRMEQIGDRIYVDGGHNVDGIEAFIESVKKHECKGKKHLIYSAVADKQVGIIGDMLIRSGAFDRIAICEIDSSRATKLGDLLALFESLINDAGSVISLESYPDAASAVAGEYEQIGEEDRLYICGSLYLVGAVKEYIEAK